MALAEIFWAAASRLNSASQLSKLCVFRQAGWPKAAVGSAAMAIARREPNLQEARADNFSCITWSVLNVAVVPLEGLLRPLAPWAPRAAPSGTCLMDSAHLAYLNRYRRTNVRDERQSVRSGRFPPISD